MNYKTYLFDFDYTLADSSRGIVKCFRIVLTRHQYLTVTDEAIKRTIGKTLEESFSILTGVTDPAQLAAFRQEYRQEADTHEREYPSFSRHIINIDSAEKTRRPYRHYLY